MSKMKFLHTMIRVNNLEESIKFYTDVMGMTLNKKTDYESGKFTLAFLGYGSIESTPQVELTYNWDVSSYELGSAFGHLAVEVEDIFKFCEDAKTKGVKVTREPGVMKFGGNTIIAFIEDPNGYKIELIEHK
jgi:lactoylglutathione lyase